MKKIINFILAITILLITNVAYADSCIMITDSKITDVSCTNNEIICLNILTTLSNEKKSLIVSSKKDGECEFTIKLNKSNYRYKAIVQDGKLTIKGSSKIKVLPIDLPPEILPQGE